LRLTHLENVFSQTNFSGETHEALLPLPCRTCHAFGEIRHLGG
jgi:hypothetical protein